MAKTRLSRLTSKTKGLLGIKSVSDLGQVIYAVLGISLLGDKIVNVVNMQGTAFAKPLISIGIAWFLTPKPLRKIITIIVALTSLGLGISSIGNLGGIANKGFGVYGQRQGTDTANVIGRLP